MALPVELTLEDYWRILRRRSGFIFFSLFVTLILTAVYTFYQDPVYSSTTTIKIEPPAGETGVGGAFSNWDYWSGINTEIHVIRSGAVAEKALRRLGKLDDTSPPEKVGSLVADFMGRIQAKRVGDTTLVNVVAEAPDPAEAARYVEVLAEAYIERDKVTRSRQNEKALENINRRKAHIESILHSLEDTKRRMMEAAPTGALAAESLAGRLFDLEAKKNILLDRYTSAHPEVLKLSKEMEVLERKLRALPRGALEVARVERDIRINEQLYTSLATQYEEHRVKAASIVSLATVVSRPVENPIPVRPNRTANMMFGVALGLVLGLMLAFVAENLDTSLVTVEEVEKALELPVLGLIPHITHPEAKERPALLAWMGMGRHEPIEELRRRMIIHQSPHAPVVEAYHSFRASLDSVLQRETGHLVVFTSSGIAEGKSLSCLNFSLAAVQAGSRVLMLDVDFRRPSLHRMLGVDNDMGLTNVVVGGRPVEDAIKGMADFMIGSDRVDDLLKSQGIENLHLMSGGSIKVSPPDFFKREEFGTFIETLRHDYDWIIMDCPPLLLFADGLLIGPKVDGVVLLYQVGRMARAALKRAKEELLTVKARPLGIVINDVRPKELEPRYGYYRSSYYYDYYYEKEEEKQS